MKRSSSMDVLRERNTENELFRKREFKGERPGENELKVISSGGVFR